MDGEAAGIVLRRIHCVAVKNSGGQRADVSRGGWMAVVVRGSRRDVHGSREVSR